jgi:predicted RNA-binding Zn-ribbon protein involved in translation (DUF1610 family)
MDFSVLVAIVILAAVVFFLKSGQFSKQHPDSFPYEKQKRLLTPAERSFFGVLEQVVGESHRIFVKVRLGDLFKVKAGLSNSGRATAFNKISAKHVDFVICSNESVDVLAAIELDDKSHNLKKRQERDQFVDKVFESAGVPLGHIAAQKSYSVQEVSRIASSLLNIPSDSDQKDEAEFSMGDEVPIYEDIANFSFESESKSVPYCPSCGNTMVKRQAKKGKHSGELFWACSLYPKCREILSIKQ